MRLRFKTRVKVRSWKLGIVGLQNTDPFGEADWNPSDQSTNTSISLI